jgi:hypothetical protein
LELEVLAHQFHRVVDLTLVIEDPNMLYILYKSSGVYSGRALRKVLGELRGDSVKGGFPKRFRQLLANGRVPEMVVNLGTTDELPYEGAILNSQDMVRASSNKRLSRIAFSEADVPAPTLFLHGGDVKERDLPVIGRTSYHRKGQGFWFCRTRREVLKAIDEGATHFLEFVPNTREYRVHTFIRKSALGVPPTEREAEDYISIKVSEKVWQGEGQPDPDAPQKNHEFGWIFLGQQNRRAEELDVVRYAAKQAIAVLGMDFGAVDLMYKLRTKEPYVLEVNSTPSLADDNANTCEVYARRILKTLGQDEED